MIFNTLTFLLYSVFKIERLGIFMRGEQEKKEAMSAND